MALDRFVSFPDRFPNEESIQKLLENFVGDPDAVERKDHELPYWVVRIHGKTSFALSHEHPELMPSTLGERWIEVFFHPAEDDEPNKVDVLTRGMDEYTNALANGLVNIFCRYWRGIRDPD